ncbi:MAG: hypothetical protein GOMPHAMPRED_005655 [Gomphillus americanus]|uniref:Uncharacterized protein n=1 Tax=Gomphillus americanus TaxID=1940652 RepID=A0A8H3FSS4_9LECA|nr:MAG: hypothetical protein GOMPHAMPRED_005655 [Gomphillus americanus]
MSGTSSDTPGTNLASDSISTTGNSTATPIIIGASVAAVALFLSLVFLVFYIIRRRRSEYQYYSDEAAFSLYRTDKEDSLPPEPNPPPLPYKDMNNEKDLESGMKPLLPPKDFGRPFVRSKRVVEIQDSELPAFPERTFLKAKGGMF